MTATPNEHQVYTTASGRVYCVCPGIGGPGWGTYDLRPNGTHRRVVSPYLPLMPTRREALFAFRLWIGSKTYGHSREAIEYRPIYKALRYDDLHADD